MFPQKILSLGSPSSASIRSKVYFVLTRSALLGFWEWTLGFFANCLVLTINFILGVLLLSNGNSLLLYSNFAVFLSAVSETRAT